MNRQLSLFSASQMEVNFPGTFAVTQAFAPVLAKNGGGAVANLNSVASFVSFPILATYSASKAATHSLSSGRSLWSRPPRNASQADDW